jgi:hypothetical protein
MMLFITEANVLIVERTNLEKNARSMVGKEPVTRKNHIAICVGLRQRSLANY